MIEQPKESEEKQDSFYEEKEEKKESEKDSRNKEDLDLISSVVDDFSEVEEIKKPVPKKSMEHFILQGPSEKIEKKAQEFLEKQKDYGKYEPVRTDYPLFLQLPNACGLSSVLMLIDPIQNQQIGRLLDRVWNHYEKITAIEQARKEFQWAYALDYLLLKSGTPNAISEYIKSLNVEDLDHYYMGLESVLRFYQQEHLKLGNNIVVNAYEDYFAHGLVTQFIVTQHTDLFKHNPEIQILMALFGYEIVKQPAPDGTGALFFTVEELKNAELPSAKKKIKILRSEFIKGARIVIGFSFHWVILTNIFNSNGKLHVSINDPAGKKYDIPYANLSDRDRFYIYRKMKNTPRKLWTQIGKMLEEDGPSEIALAEEFMNTVKDRLVIKGEPDEEGKFRVKIQVNSEGKRTPLRDTKKSISVKVHEETFESIKRTKMNETQIKSKSEHIVDEENEEEEKDMSSKEGFMKKMQKIIGDKLQDYD